VCQREGRTGVSVAKIFGVSEGGENGVRVGRYLVRERERKTRVSVGVIFGFECTGATGEGRIAT